MLRPHHIWCARVECITEPNLPSDVTVQNFPCLLPANEAYHETFNAAKKMKWSNQCANSRSTVVALHQNVASDSRNAMLSGMEPTKRCHKTLKKKTEMRNCVQERVRS